MSGTRRYTAVEFVEGVIVALAEERAALLTSLIRECEGMRDAYKHSSDCRPEVDVCFCSANDVHNFADDVLTLLRARLNGRTE